MNSDPGPHSVRQVAGHYAMPRLTPIGAVFGLLAFAAVAIVAGLIGLLGYHLFWAKLPVDLGCMAIILAALRLLIGARRFWIFAGRPPTLNDPLRFIVLSAVVLAVNFAFLVVDLATVLQLSP